MGSPFDASINTYGEVGETVATRSRNAKSFLDFSTRTEVVGRTETARAHGYLLRGRDAVKLPQSSGRCIGREYALPIKHGQPDLLPLLLRVLLRHRQTTTSILDAYIQSAQLGSRQLTFTRRFAPPPLTSDSTPLHKVTAPLPTTLHRPSFGLPVPCSSTRNKDSWP